MADERELIKKRFTELSERSYSSGIFTFTDFLGLAEQSLLRECERLFASGVTLFGGAPDCERVMARFGSEEELGYSVDFPIVCIKAEPKSQKFADKLTHRDFLGALLNLGIEREKLGDIAIIDNVGYIFATEGIADFIISELRTVKHTDVSLSPTEPPSEALSKTERRMIQANGERLDAVIAKVFSLSRDEAQLLFSRGLVFASGREISSTSYIPKRDEIVSVRGKGRFVYRGYETLSRKGKLNIAVDLYV
ncbi:MAG: hypothetical protein IKC34_00230 [Clostridia bacterium]|nr:hypothetical protein [Clostridia bacterium]